MFGGYSGWLIVGAGENRQHAQADVAQVVRALGEQLIAQPGEPVGVGGDRLLPRERGALALGDRGLGDLEKIRIGDQLLVRGEDRRLRRIGLGVKLRAQRGELSLRGGDGGGEAAALGVHARARLRSRRSPRGGPGTLRRPPARARPARRAAGWDRSTCAAAAARPPARRSSSPARARARSPRRRSPAASTARELLHRGRRVRAAGHHLHLRAVLDFQRHDRRHAARVGLPVAELELDRPTGSPSRGSRAPPRAARAGRWDSESRSASEVIVVAPSAAAAAPPPPST